MSADDFYIVRKHPNGGYAAVHGFASSRNKDGTQYIPEATDKHLQFKTTYEALDYGIRKDPEYGVAIHDECRKKRWWRR